MKINTGAAGARRVSLVVVGLVAAVMATFALAPAAEASVTTNYWWGKSTWYSQSEVRQLQPTFRRMSDLAAGGGGAAAGSVCAAMGLAYVVPGLVCGVIVAGGFWYISDQASKLDYAASRKMCARIDVPRFGLPTVTPYACSWR